MVITESQWRLAEDMLTARRMLGGPPFSHEDVQRLAEGIAKRTWIENQLATCQAEEKDSKL